MGKISLQDLSSVLVERRRIGKKEASQFVNEMFYLIQKKLNEEKIVKIKGLGTFKIIDVEDRESVDVNTGDRVLIEGHGKITFTPDALMKELVNKPFSQFETVVLNEGVEFDDLTDDLTEEELAEVDAMDEEQQPAIVPVAIIESEEPKEPEAQEEPKEPEKPIVPVEPTAPEEPIAPEAEAPSVEPLMEVVDLPDDAQPAAEQPQPVSMSGESDTFDEDEEAERHWKKTLGYCLLTLALMAASAYAGYWYGQRTAAPAPEEPAVQPVSEVVVNDSIEDLAADSTATDSVKIITEQTPVPAPEAKPEPAPAAKPEPAPKAETEPFWKKYEIMDARVRTGAYHIIGTDHEVTVRQGETLSRIARRELGEGMSCYIEVYNGLKGDAQLKEGQVIKVPKLKWKKSKK